MKEAEDTWSLRPEELPAQSCSLILGLWNPVRHTVHALTLRHTRFKDFLMKMLLNIERRVVQGKRWGHVRRNSKPANHSQPPPPPCPLHETDLQIGPEKILLSQYI